MKTAKHLYPILISFPNLLSAYYKARKGKRMRDNVGRFDLHLERHLVRLQDTLTAKTYRPGKYRQQQKAYAQGQIALHGIQSSVQAWIAHASHAHSYRLRATIFSQLVLQKHVPVRMLSTL